MASTYLTSKMIDIVAWLHQRNNLSECYLMDFWPERFCLDMVVLVDNIWQNETTLRENLDEQDLWILRFGNCEGFDLYNDMPKSWLQEPARIQPGINEFSLARIQQANETEILLFEFLWESKRRLSIKCRQIEVISVPDINCIQRQR